MKIKQWLTNSGQAIKEVYKAYGYWLVSIFFIIFIFMIHALLINYKLLFSVFSITLWLKLTVGLFSAMDPVSLIFLSIVAFFGSMVLSMSIFLVKRQLKGGFSAGGTGILVGLIAPACPSCALGLFGVIGIGGFLTTLPFKGLEFGIVGVIILLASLVYLSNKITTQVCIIKKKRKRIFRMR